MRRIGPVLLAVILAACGTGGGSMARSSISWPSDGPRTPSLPTNASPDPVAALARFLADELTLTGAPGALAVVRHDASVIRGSAGTADTDGTLITSSTRFRVASITKPIVAALVLVAVDRGLLSLDDQVARLLPGVVPAQPPTTVRQLLDHTSGIFDEGNEGDPKADIERIGDAALRAEARDLLARALAGEPLVVPDRVIVALAMTHDRYFPPGTGYHYSNVNYQLAAMILERRTGRTLAELLRDWVTAPLGLHHMSLAPADRASPELRGYEPNGGSGLRDVTDQLAWFGNGGSGGILSTADDLLATMQAIVTARLFPASLVTEMKRPNRSSYGLGLATYPLACGMFHGHEGAVLGTRSIALVSDDGASGVVAAVNVLTPRDPLLVTLAQRLVCRPS